MADNQMDPSQKDDQNASPTGEGVAGSETPIMEQKPKVDIDILSTILTDQDVRTEELKKRDQEKRNPFTQESSTPEVGMIFDINIKSIQEPIHTLLQEKYDFVVFEPMENYVKVVYKKDSMVKETHYIKHPAYYNIVLQAKKVAKLSTEINQEEQKGKGTLLFGDKGIEVLVKFIPGNFGETLYFKIQAATVKKEVSKQKKKSMSVGKAFGILAVLLLIALILGGTFLTFVVLNAKTPDDVSFFHNLGISLNQVNDFLLKATNLIFSIVISIETILVTFLFLKAFLTKKEFKKQRVGWFVVSVFILCILFASATLWLFLYKQISNLPNWQEMSYGNIQLYDNSLLASGEFKSDNALLSDASNLIGPIEIKFDVKYLAKEEAKKGFTIKKYVWDFGDGKRDESPTSDIIHNYDTQGTHDLKLTIVGTDRKSPDEETEKDISETPKIGIKYLVKIIEEKQSNGGKTVKFDATEVSKLGKIEWYLPNDLKNPAYVGKVFQPSKVYFEQEMIGMRIATASSIPGVMDRVFVISGENADIKGKISYEVSYDDDLEYNFQVKDIENQFGDGFINSFTRYIEEDVIPVKGDIQDIENSSKVSHTFENYGPQTVRVVLTNSNNKSQEIRLKINVPKRIKLNNEMTISTIDGTSQTPIKNYDFDKKTGEYFLFDLPVPQTFLFETKNIRPTDNLYSINKVSWDTDGNGTYDKDGSSLTYEYPRPGKKTIGVKYTLQHRKNKADTVEVTQKIYLEGVQKDVVVDFAMKADSEYVPTIVAFDSSLTKVTNDNIIKFVYDYGDGVVEEGAAVNIGHRYSTAGNYKIKLTIYTQNGKQYSAVKDLILKPSPMLAKIAISLKKAPVGQEINFTSTDSVGQVVGYSWDFGDGEMSRDANPSHAFSKAGKYKVTLTLDFADRNIKKDSIEVEITP